ncbi:MAG: hypothetical protein IT561_08325 [Alphaproteobacteria bacterium]|nr:hypothetical protein [Alphaproteobacteria bacterium]
MLQAVMLGLGVVAVGLAVALLRGALSGVDRLFAAGLVVLALVFGWLAFSDPLEGAADAPIASARARSVPVPPAPSFRD